MGAMAVAPIDRGMQTAIGIEGIHFLIHHYLPALRMIDLVERYYIYIAHFSLRINHAA